MKNSKHLFAITGLVLALGFGFSSNAKADDWHGRSHDRWEHERGRRDHGRHYGHWEHRNYYYGYPGQYVIYKPVPRYIAPPPVVYYPAPQPSGINLVFPMRFD